MYKSQSYFYELGCCVGEIIEAANNIEKIDWNLIGHLAKGRGEKS